MTEMLPTGEVPAVPAQPAIGGLDLPPVAPAEAPASPATAPAAPAAEPDGRPYAVVTVIGLADDRIDLLAPEARQALAEAQVV
ncbi:MAG: hypothetical protein ACRDZR_16145, partial [Acidimicrobiales bacterium]